MNPNAPIKTLWGKASLAVCLLLAAALFLKIWTGDHRWAQTAWVLFAAWIVTLLGVAATSGKPPKV